MSKLVLCSKKVQCCSIGILRASLSCVGISYVAYPKLAHILPFAEIDLLYMLTFVFVDTGRLVGTGKL